MVVCVPASVSSVVQLVTVVAQLSDRDYAISVRGSASLAPGVLNNSIERLKLDAVPLSLPWSGICTRPAEVTNTLTLNNLISSPVVPLQQLTTKPWTVSICIPGMTSVVIGLDIVLSYGVVA